MIHKSLFSLLAFLLIACGSGAQNALRSAGAADLNGYTARYECKSGGANCNVDIAAYIAHACDTTITTSDSISTINSKTSGNQYICVENGDYRAKGRITLSASGTSGARKVFRYTRSGDTDDEPWNQSAGNQAALKYLTISGDYWIVQRITVDPQTATGNAIIVSGDHNIIERSQALNGGNSSNLVIFQSTASDSAFQNGVVHASAMQAGTDNECINNQNADDTKIVNNEIYACGGTGIDNTAGATNARIENNDVYGATSQLSDCNGNLTPSDPDSECASMETPIGFKGNTGSGNGHIVLHNRIWNSRFTDTNLCCASGGAGAGIVLGGDTNGNTSWTLVKNNIILTSQHGVQFSGDASTSDNTNNSVIGNFMFTIQQYHTDSGASRPFRVGTRGDDSEFYLNTVVGADAWGMLSNSGNGSLDARCNALIDSGADDGNATPDGNTQVDYNFFYGTTEYTTESPDNDVGNYALNTRANSTAYTLCSTDASTCMIRTTATPPADGTAGDFIYRVVTAGTTDSSPPTYCTKLNCVVVDGTAVLRAVRGPYKFFRQLRTVSAGTATWIPYARSLNTTALPEQTSCPSSYASRTGIGVDDSTDPGSTRLF